MTEPAILALPDGRRIAHHRVDGSGPGVVFLGGFRSDMTGTKAMFLEERCRRAGRAFLRFDYTGHGASSGDFVGDGCIGAWARDAADAVRKLTDGPQVLVGSSMGGWISLLLAKRMPEKVAGLVTIAAAPDFTEDTMWGVWDESTRRTLMETGRIEEPSDYSDEPYVITRRLIEDGRENLVLRESLPLPFPVRMLQGTADTDVPQERALTLLAHAEGDDIRLLLVKGADHRFSGPEELDVIGRAVDEVLEAPRARRG